MSPGRPNRSSGRLWTISVWLTAVLTSKLLLCQAGLTVDWSKASRRLLAEDGLPESKMEPAATQTAGVQPPEVFWILLVGDSKTGKTSLVNRLLTDTFTLKHRPTEGAYSKQHPLQLGGKDARLQVWDTAGQEAFRKVVTSIYRNIQAVLVVFDPHDRATFESAQRLWLPEVKEFAAPNAIKMLVGTKSDLGEAVVSGPEAQAVADAAGVTYIPTSALNNQNVTSLFQRLGEDMAAQRVAANV